MIDRRSETRALILAGGLGSRLRPLTETVPKCLVPIHGKPLLDYWIDNLASAGVLRVLINTHHLADVVRNKIEDLNAQSALALDETYEAELLGSAGTITANRAFADGADDVLIIYADNLSNVDLTEFMGFHRSHGEPFTMLLFHSPDPSSCGIAELNSQNKIVEFIEKPDHPKSDLANGGVYAVTADAYREIADRGDFDLGFDVLPKFVGRMQGFVFDGYHRDIGNLEALRQAEADVDSGIFGNSAEPQHQNDVTG